MKSYIRNGLTPYTVKQQRRMEDDHNRRMQRHSNAIHIMPKMFSWLLDRGNPHRLSSVTQAYRAARLHACHDVNLIMIPRLPR